MNLRSPWQPNLSLKRLSRARVHEETFSRKASARKRRKSNLVFMIPPKDWQFARTKMRRFFFFEWIISVLHLETDSVTFWRSLCWIHFQSERSPKTFFSDSYHSLSSASPQGIETLFHMHLFRPHGQPPPLFSRLATVQCWTGWSPEVKVAKVYETDTGAKLSNISSEDHHAVGVK